MQGGCLKYLPALNWQRVQLKYGGSPSLCTAVLSLFCTAVCGAPRICTAVLLPFVQQYFSHCYDCRGSALGNGVGVTGSCVQKGSVLWTVIPDCVLGLDPDSQDVLAKWLVLVQIGGLGSSCREPLCLVAKPSRSWGQNDSRASGASEVLFSVFRNGLVY